MRTRRWALGLVTAALAGGACGSATKSPVATPRPVPTTAAGPLVAPRTTPAQDGRYFQDLALADPALSSYVQTGGDTALKALLTDGSAFCAFLGRGGGIDNAMTSLAIGADSVEAQTHLPSSVTTFNAIDAAALLALCPGEQALLPPADRTRIEALGRQLAGGVPSPAGPAGPAGG